MAELTNEQKSASQSLEDRIAARRAAAKPTPAEEKPKKEKKAKSVKAEEPPFDPGVVKPEDEPKKERKPREAKRKVAPTEPADETEVGSAIEAFRERIVRDVTKDFEGKIREIEKSHKATLKTMVSVEDANAAAEAAYNKGLADGEKKAQKALRAALKGA